MLFRSADEWQASFLNYWPKIIVLNNIEREHLDYYKDLKHILKTYKEFITHLPKNGVIVGNKDDKNVVKICKRFKKYSLTQGKKLKNILRVPGQHNVYNALAALTTARILKIPDKISFKALAGYKGVWRRFEIKKVSGFQLISDYAHHPTEIKPRLMPQERNLKTKRFGVFFNPINIKEHFICSMILSKFFLRLQ